MKLSLNELALHWMQMPIEKLVNSRSYFEAQKMFMFNAFELHYSTKDIAEFSGYSHVSPIIVAIKTIQDWIEIDRDLRAYYFQKRIV
jgi:hypothetical protein